MITQLMKTVSMTDTVEINQLEVILQFLSEFRLLKKNHQTLHHIHTNDSPDNDLLLLSDAFTFNKIDLNHIFNNLEKQNVV